MPAVNQSLKIAFFAFALIALIGSVLVLFVSQESENAQRAAPNPREITVSGDENQENSTPQAFSLGEMEVSRVHGSEGYTMSDINIEISR